MDHRECVDALIERSGGLGSPARARQVFERAFNAVWRRTRVVLGDVTLTAITDRVLYQAALRYPLLASLKLGGEGLDVQAFRPEAGEADQAHIEAGLRFILIEQLAVIGSLTAEILTPGLHRALAELYPTMGAPPFGRASNEGETSRS